MKEHQNSTSPKNQFHFHTLKTTRALGLFKLREISCMLLCINDIYTKMLETIDILTYTSHKVAWPKTLPVIVTEILQR